MRRRLFPLLAAGSLVLAGCSAQGGDAAGESTAADTPEVISVVASTSVYGDLAAAVGGEHVEVTSIVDSVSQDPHSYEATAQDKLAVSKADVVVLNGGGYDAFMEQLLKATDLGEGRVVTVFDLAEAAHEEGAHDHEDEHASAEAEHSEDEHEDHGHADEHEGHEHGEVNEHVWYDFHVMHEAVEHVRQALQAAAPQHEATFAAQAAELGEELEGFETRVGALAESDSDATYAMTEPLPFYLMEEAGLTNVTPEGYSEAIEHGEDVPPLLQQQLLDALAAGEVSVLAYNPQSASPQTEAVREAAEAAGVPVVELTETLPDGQDYAGWMSANLDALEAALAR